MDLPTGNAFQDVRVHSRDAKAEKKKRVSRGEQNLLYITRFMNLLTAREKLCRLDALHTLIYKNCETKQR